MHSNYEIVEFFANNLIIVSKQVKENFVNNNGNIETYECEKFNILNNNQLIFDTWFDIYFIDKTTSYENCIIGFKNSLREIMYKSTCEQYLDMNGKLLSIYQYSYGVIDAYGKIIVTPIFDRISCNDNCYTVCYNEKFGYIGMDGSAIAPLAYDGAGNFRCGLAHIEYNGKSGYISKDTVIKDADDYSSYAISPMYDWGSDFEDGFARVKDGNYILLIDKENNVIDKYDIKKYYK